MDILGPPNNLSVFPQGVLPSQCSLGEGLFAKSGKATWLDINNNRVFRFDGVELQKFDTLCKPSVIFGVSSDEIILGSDVGIALLNNLTGRETIQVPLPANHDKLNYRSNDGGFCGEHQLLGFMHRTDPKSNRGFIYRVSGGSFVPFDDTLHIPNAFIEISPAQILISDSLQGLVWLYELDASGQVEQKSLWAKVEEGIAPDGGCLLDDLILVALWDGSAIAIYDKGGARLGNITVPVIRPTNCKYDEEQSLLWVTSASEGLSAAQVCNYPHSGDTFSYRVEFR